MGFKHQLQSKMYIVQLSPTNMEPIKINSKRHSGPTTEVLRRQGEGYGESRGVGPVCGCIRFSNLWGCPLSKRGWFGGPSHN